MKSIFLGSALFCANALNAQELPYLTCKNPSPIWTLNIQGDTAQFLFAEKTINFDVADRQISQPGPWPVALTLLARSDTAIVIVRPEDEGYLIDILTQNRQLPILLSGQCVTQGIVN